VLVEASEAYFQYPYGQSGQQRSQCSVVSRLQSVRCGSLPSRQMRSSRPVGEGASQLEHLPPCKRDHLVGVAVNFTAACSWVMMTIGPAGNAFLLFRDANRKFAAPLYRG